MWPGGKLAESPPLKTDAEKFETRMAAKNKLLQNIPGEKTWKNMQISSAAVSSLMIY